MSISDWLTLAVVIVALAIGVTSVVQTKRIQTKQYKYSLLDNILQWALSIPRCIGESTISPSAADLVNMEKEDRTELASIINFLDKVAWIKKYTTINAETKSVKAIAEVFKNKKLNKAITKTANRLKAHIKLLSTDVGKLPGKVVTVEEYAKSIGLLDKSAIDLSKLIAGILANLVSNKS